MEKSKLLWWRTAIVVALIITAIPVIYYIFVSGNFTQKQIARENFAWEQNAEIMKLSARFKSIDPGSKHYLGYENSRLPESRLLLPIVKIGMSADEVHELLGEPSRIEFMRNGNIQWHYICYASYEIIIEISNGEVVKKEEF
jgi:hypothetical protein